MVYAYNGTLFSHKKEWHIDITIWMSLETLMFTDRRLSQKSHILYDPISTKMSNKVKSIKTE